MIAVMALEKKKIRRAKLASMKNWSKKVDPLKQKKKQKITEKKWKKILLCELGIVGCLQICIFCISVTVTTQIPKVSMSSFSSLGGSISIGWLKFCFFDFIRRSTVLITYSIGRIKTLNDDEKLTDILFQACLGTRLSRLGNWNWNWSFPCEHRLWTLFTAIIQLLCLIVVFYSSLVLLFIIVEILFIP